MAYSVKMESAGEHYDQVFHQWTDINRVCDVAQYFESKADAQKFADSLNDLAWQLLQNSNPDASVQTLEIARHLGPRFVVTNFE